MLVGVVLIVASYVYHRLEKRLLGKDEEPSPKSPSDILPSSEVTSSTTAPTLSDASHVSDIPTSTPAPPEQKTS
jgi:hypothetical protein